MKNKVAVLNPKEFGVEPQVAEGFVKGLNVVRQERELLIQEFNRVSKLEITPENIEKYRELRLKVQKNRTQGIAKWHKKMKEIPLRQGKLIDAIRNNEDSINKQMEEVLMNGEKHYEILEKEKQEKIQAERVAQITFYIEDADQRDFTKFEQDEFDAFLAIKKKQHEDKIEEDKKAELDRLAKEKADELERENRRKEVERLKAEAEVQEKALEKERADNLAKQKAIEAKAEKERLEAKAIQDAKDKKVADDLAKERAEAKAKQDKIDAENAKLQAELKAKQDAEEKAKKEAVRLAEEEIKKAQELAKAPIKEQLSIWIEAFELPHLRTENETALEIKNKFDSFKKWAQNQVNNI